MTSTPAYGFKIGAGKGGGVLQKALRAGDIRTVKGVLTQQFPNLKFEDTDTAAGEVEKPTEVQAAPTPMAETAAAEDKEETTGTLYGDYMAGLPGGVRELVTTDYKGVRGSRLGRGNYTTASIIPGAQVQTPAPAPAPSPAPSTGGGVTTTYNAPVVGGDWQQFYGDYYGGDVNYGTIGGAAGAPAQATAGAPAQAAGGGLTPAWAKSNSQQKTTTKQAASGFVPSTTQRGVYVAPSSPQASTTAQNVSQAVTSRVESGSGLGIKAAAAAAGDPNKLGTNAVAAIIAAPGSDRKAAEATLRKYEKGKIELTNEARKALEKLVK